MTLFTAFPSTLQAPVPVQAPDQPVKVEPVAGACVTATVVLAGTAATQPAVLVQATGGVTATVTVPVPPFALAGLTVRGQVDGGKVAVTDRLPVRLVRTQEAPSGEPAGVQPTQVGMPVLAPVTTSSV